MPTIGSAFSVEVANQLVEVLLTYDNAICSLVKLSSAMDRGTPLKNGRVCSAVNLSEFDPSNLSNNIIIILKNITSVHDWKPNSPLLCPDLQL